MIDPEETEASLSASRASARATLKALEDLERDLRDDVLDAVLAGKATNEKMNAYAQQWDDAEDTYGEWQDAIEVEFMAVEQMQATVDRMVALYEEATRSQGLTDRGRPEDVEERLEMSRRSAVERRLAKVAEVVDPITLMERLKANLERMVREGKL